MQYYFSLQYKRLARWLQELGVHPVIGVLLGLVLFIAASWYLFWKIEVAGWLYAGIAVLTLGRMSEVRRNEELKRMCKGVEYKKWRIVENMGSVLPFVIYLLYEREWWVAMLLLLIGIALSFVTFRQVIFRTIPTPFRKIPFEAIVGFRKTVLVFLIMLLIVIKAIDVGNFNLGLVLLAATYLVQMSYYLITENDYFVWIFSLDVKSFLKRKWASAQMVALVISIPFALLLGIFFIEKIAFILAAVAIGHLWVSAAVFAKYATFPKEMNVAQSFIFAGAIILFPFLAALIPFYIKKSHSKLELYLK